MAFSGHLIYNTFWDNKRGFHIMKLVYKNIYFNYYFQGLIDKHVLCNRWLSDVEMGTKPLLDPENKVKLQNSKHFFFKFIYTIYITHTHYTFCNL